MRHIPALMRGRAALRSVAPFLTSALILSGCGGGYGGGGGGSGGMNPCGGIYQACPKPTATLTAPAAGTVHGMVTITATASASTANGLTVARVDFMLDGSTMIGSATASPYSVAWDSTKATNGSHTLTATVTDSMNDTGTSAPVAVTVQNAAALSATMTPSQLFPAPNSTAAGTVQVRVELETGAITARVALQRITPTGVTLNEGFAGASGRVVFALAPRPAGEWEAPSGALLTAEQTGALLRGGLYVIATSAAHPRGEIRAQLLPGNVKVAFAELAPTAQAATFGVAADGVAALTVDASAATVTVHVSSRGVEDAHASELLSRTSAGESQLGALSKDGVDMGHWSTELVHLDPAELTGFANGAWSVRVATPVLPAGALRGDVNAPGDAH